MIVTHRLIVQEYIIGPGPGLNRDLIGSSLATSSNSNEARHGMSVPVSMPGARAAHVLVGLGFAH